MLGSQGIVVKCTVAIFFRTVNYQLWSHKETDSVFSNTVYIEMPIAKILKSGRFFFFGGGGVLELLLCRPFKFQIASHNISYVAFLHLSTNNYLNRTSCEKKELLMNT